MDRSEYLRLLSEASVNDTSKFRLVDPERRYSSYDGVITRILPKDVADPLRPKGSSLAHLYGSPQTHKERLPMRPVFCLPRTPTTTCWLSY